MKTAKEIQGDIINLLRESPLAQAVSGQIYRKGYRPLNSKSEDIIVGFVTGMTGEIEEGVVVVNIHVADIPFGNGLLVENGERTAEIERLAADWVESLKASHSNYIFSLSQSIYTEAEREVAEHFVSVRLSYRFYNS